MGHRSQENIDDYCDSNSSMPIDSTTRIIQDGDVHGVSFPDANGSQGVFHLNSEDHRKKKRCRTAEPSILMESVPAERNASSIVIEKRKRILPVYLSDYVDSNYCNFIDDVANVNIVKNLRIDDCGRRRKLSNMYVCNVDKRDKGCVKKRQLSTAVELNCTSNDKGKQQVSFISICDTVPSKQLVEPRRKYGQHSKKNISIFSTFNHGNIPFESSTLIDVFPCTYCHAKQFPKEPPSFCCSNEEVSLVCSPISPILHELYFSIDDDAIEFRKFVRTYNNTFAFTSFGVKYDKDLCRRNKGIYTFKVLGQVHHFINQLIPNESVPSNL
ncbi:ATP-dependent DNA helicase [Quillaja saponaria]|uniref:ATP-dependent DNA helicase n=1 Tax=Quillaja saponaria TaxID=32244 RepID=A0AAD7KNF9_QUISA|nr:ATP-dependent DNA helicase [Quillaja saponaria]